MIVPIFTDEVANNGGWHGQALQKAFARRGHQVVLVDLRDCVIDLSTQHPRITIPHLNTLPSIAFVRGVAPGSLQQVITRLNVLHMLNMQGTYIYNDAKAIERTVDKGMTSFLLKQHGVATPATWVCESRDEARNIFEQQVELHQRLVIKPLFGSMGKGVRLLDAQTPLPVPKEAFMDGVYYLQQYIDTAPDYADFRVFVIDGEAVATMQRKGSGWLNNVAQGADCMSVIDAEIADTALQASKALDIDYCGVDVMRDSTGQLWVLEVNSIPAWRALQSVTTIDIAQVLVDDLLSKVGEVNGH